MPAEPIQPGPELAVGEGQTPLRQIRGGVRIGIGDRGPIDAADFVLSRFRPAERPIIDDALISALQAVAVWVSQGIAPAMNRFN